MLTLRRNRNQSTYYNVIQSSLKSSDILWCIFQCQKIKIDHLDIQNKNIQLMHFYSLWKTWFGYRYIRIPFIQITRERGKCAKFNANFCEVNFDLYIRKYAYFAPKNDCTFIRFAVTPKRPTNDKNMLVKILAVPTIYTVGDKNIAENFV